MKLEAICKNYGDIRVLKDFNLTIKDKEILCVLGPSGCGKSTLLNILAGILKPDGGRIEEKKKKVGYVFQEDRLLPWKTLRENIQLVDKKAPSAEIEKIIDIIGLKGFEDKYPAQLSGGMRQRSSIGRAFNFQAEMLLMDEPFKSLDYDLRIKMVRNLIDIWQQWNNSIVFVTHEIDEALLLGNKIAVLTKNPCTVETIFTINSPQAFRRLEDRELIDLRSKLIKILSKDNDLKAFKSA